MSVRIICHMITSLDSRIITSRWDLPADFDVTAVYEGTAQQLGAQGWIVGRTTMAEYADNISEGAPALTEPSAQEDFKGAWRKGQQLAVVFDLKGKLHYEGCTLPSGEHLTAVLSHAVSPAYVKELKEQGLSVVFTTDDEQKQLRTALDRLQQLFPHVKTLLLEGGGTINGSFLKAGLIDELSLIVCPVLDGAAGVQNFLNFKGAAEPCPGAGQRLTLIEQQTCPGGALYQHWRLEH